MNRPILAIALSLTILMICPSFSMAFYTRGTITRDISYDRLAISKPPSNAETYHPVASGVLINKTRQKIVLSAELSFCNVFGEPLGTTTVYCTIPPMKKTSFKEYLSRNTPAGIKDAHHVEWTVISLRKK
ncbi:hypothetical protein DSLASN_26790 [Desulfoluna limicola]|uniref:Uncharacterized protein n=1 Tax=Desulfoluna limicola TaxID=2810562 RepID=A0ABM7PHJ1_9BACT|nr:hypothetical protein [Desulfoluna limicola]BCS97047.1 hypothetical protein DSLASN_26790 [Desulfoluna limicola]